MSWQHAGMVPVERAELVTRDVDLLAELASQLYVDHGPRSAARTRRGPGA